MTNNIFTKKVTYTCTSRDTETLLNVLSALDIYSKVEKHIIDDLTDAYVNEITIKVRKNLSVKTLTNRLEKLSGLNLIYLGTPKVESK